MRLHNQYTITRFHLFLSLFKKRERFNKNTVIVKGLNAKFKQPLQCYFIRNVKIPTHFISHCVQSTFMCISWSKDMVFRQPHIVKEKNSLVYSNFTCFENRTPNANPIPHPLLLLAHSTFKVTHPTWALHHIISVSSFTKGLCSKDRHWDISFSEQFKYLSC